MGTMTLDIAALVAERDQLLADKQRALCLVATQSQRADTAEREHTETRGQLRQLQVDYDEMASKAAERLELVSNLSKAVAEAERDRDIARIEVAMMRIELVVTRAIVATVQEFLQVLYVGSGIQPPPTLRAQLEQYHSLEKGGTDAATPTEGS
jgi:hypothetical protein